MTFENTKRVAKSKTQRCKRQLATFQEFQDLSCPFSLFFLDSVLPSAISQSTLFDRSFLQSPIEFDFIHRVYSILIHPSTFTLYRQSIFMIYLNERLDNSFTRYTYFLFSFSKLAILRRCPPAPSCLVTTPAIFSISRQSTSTIFSISIPLVRIKFHKCNGTYTYATSMGGGRGRETG